MKCTKCANYFHAVIHQALEKPEEAEEVDYQVISGNIKVCTIINADPVTIAQQQDGVIGECTHFAPKHIDHRSGSDF